MSAAYFETIGKMEKLHILRRIILQKATADIGLYLGQLPVLEHVRANNGCTQAELAEKMFVSPASIALSTKRMEKEGLLEKHVDENNLRRNQLTITEKGRKLSTECRKIFDEVDAKMFSGFTDEELEQFMKFLDKMLSNITGGNSEDIDILTLASLERQIEIEKIKNHQKHSHEHKHNHCHEHRTEGEE